MRGDDARQLNLKTISDAARVSAQWRAGFGQDFMSRADGYPGFAQTYGFHFQEIREMDLVADLSRAGGEAGRSDRRQFHRRFDQPLRLVQLEDDRHYFPPYDAVPVARQDAAGEASQRSGEVLKQLGGILTVDEMRKLNYAVDGEKRQPNEVAREFLKQKGIIQ